MDTNIILVSHALTDWNMQGKIQGHRDVPLNQTGRQMAQLLAKRVKELDIAAIYSSDLKRALQTAGPTARLKALPVFQDMRLREGRSIAQEKEGQYPVLAFDKQWETEEEVLMRMSGALNEIAESKYGQCVLVISHAKAMELFIQSVLSDAALDPGLYLGKRTALNFLEYKTECWSVQKINDDKYLKELAL